MHVHALAHTHVIGAARQHAAAPACWTAADSPGRTGRAAPAACRSHVARQRHLGTGAVPCSGIHAHTPLYAEPTCLWTNSSSRPAPIGPARGAAPRLAMLAGPPHRGRQTQCRTGACTRTQHSARDQPAYGPTTALGRRPRAQRPRAAAHSPSTPPASRIVGERGRVGKVSRKVSRNLFHSTSKRTQRPKADLTLVLWRDLVRAYFQSVPERTGHFSTGRCPLALTRVLGWAG
jgi:hypothetical protein